MKKETITRTVSIATINVKLYEMTKDVIESKVFMIPTMKKVTVREIEDYVTENYPDYKYIKTDSVKYETSLYAIDLQSFIDHGYRIGEGRKELKE